jgi:DNA repair and recombination protein RAD52
MTLTPDQIARLQAPLNPKWVVNPTQQYGPKGDYIHGWHAINEANEIFGFDGWSYQTELKEVCQLVNGNGNIEISYICKCTLEAVGVTRQDIGYGSGAAKKAGDAHEGAVKEATTDALKRCLRTFGNQFGLALYDKSRASVGVAKPALITDEQHDDLKSIMDGLGHNMVDICRAMSVKSLKNIRAESFKKAKAIIENYNKETT